MAVQVKAKTVTCPKCNELLEYTTSDVQKTFQTQRYTVHGLDDTFYTVEDTIELWHIRCPTCHSNFQVNKRITSSRRL